MTSSIYQEQWFLLFGWLAGYEFEWDLLLFKELGYLEYLFVIRAINLMMIGGNE